MTGASFGPGSRPTDQAPQAGLDAPRFDPSRIQAVADKLNASERDLLLGKCSGWGSWMFEAGEFMASLGLATCRDGSINFDTPLAAAVIEHLRDSDRTRRQA